MREDNENGSGYKGEGIRAAIWSAFGVGTAAAAKYVLGGEGGLFGGGRQNCQYATQRDLGYERQLTEKDSEIGQLKAEKYADAATLAAERRLADKIEAIEKAMNSAVLKQAEYNVANTAAVATTNAQVLQLMRITGMVINAPTMLASEAGASAFKASSASIVANAA